MIKKTKLPIAFLLAFSLIFTPIITSHAKSSKVKVTTSVSGTKNDIKVKDAEYDMVNDDHDKDDSNVSFDFSTKVKWKKGASVTVTNEKGTVYDTIIEDKDTDECDLYVKKLAYGHTYTVKLSGIKASAAEDYGTLTISFTIPSKTNKTTALKIKDIDFEDGEVEVEFNTNIMMKKSPTITITDKNGKKYNNDLMNTKRKECNIYISEDLSSGQTYTITIDGIKTTSAKNYGKISGNFIAHYDD